MTTQEEYELNKSIYDEVYLKAEEFIESILTEHNTKDNFFDDCYSFNKEKKEKELDKHKLYEKVKRLLALVCLRVDIKNRR